MYFLTIIRRTRRPSKTFSGKRLWLHARLMEWTVPSARRSFPKAHREPPRRFPIQMEDGHELSGAQNTLLKKKVFLQKVTSTCPVRKRCMHFTYLLWIPMDTILSRIILESMVLSGRVKQVEQGRSGNPFKRNKRDCSLEDSSHNVMLGNTPSKELTSGRRWDGYMDLAGSSLWDSSATVSAQLRGSSCTGSFCRNWNRHPQNFSWSLWNVNKILFSAFWASSVQC